MITKNKLMHLIGILTIGLYSGLADATDPSKQKSRDDYFRECPDQKFEKFIDHNYNRATQDVFDKVGAQHMQTASGLTKEDMSACVRRNKFQSKEEFQKMYGTVKDGLKKGNKNTPHG